MAVSTGSFTMPIQLKTILEAYRKLHDVKPFIWPAHSQEVNPTAGV